MRRLSLMTVIAWAAAPALFAQSYGHGRIRYIEEGVSIQRATETGSEEATVNLPLLPGDRVWTDGNGRAEFQFAAGSLIRLDSASKLDYVSHEEGRDDRKVLRLWSGALYLHIRDRRDGPFEFETPGGIVTAASRGIVRIDVQSGETRVSVIEGDAALDTGTEEIRLRAGERVYARGGEAAEGPETFDRTQGDEFADWDDSRQERPAYAGSQPSTLPDDVAPYAGELEGHGAWYYETEVGHVWRPYVAANWQPYSNGRWVWSVFGWTWVPYESWGWAVSHYGRWGYGSSLGWYWIPGASWGPAWVSWAAGGDYVGWCPLGYRDRPVLVYDRFGRGTQGYSGAAVPRGATTVAQTPWIYLRRGDVGAHDLTRRRVQLASGAVQQVRVLDQARLTRDLAVTEAPPMAVARAVPRNSSGRPGLAETGPEMRTDLTTTIPVARRRGRLVDDRDDATVVEGGSLGSAPTGIVSRFGGASTRSEPAPAASARPRGAHPTDVRSGQRRGEDPAEGSGVVTRRRGDVEVRSPDRPVRERDGASEAEREVLRPMFRPLSQPRDEGRERSQPRDNGQRGEGQGRRGGAEARPSASEPREASPRQASPREAAPREAAPRPAPTPRPEPQAQPRREPPPPPPAAAARRRGSDQ